MQDRGTDRREFHRFRYPHDARPVMILDGQNGRLSELSESGLRFRAEPRAVTTYCDGETVSGVIHFSDTDMEFKGVVDRYERDEVVVSGVQGITFARIVHEQRVLSARFPGFAIAQSQRR